MSEEGETTPPPAPDPAISAALWKKVIIETLRLAAASEGTDASSAAYRYFEALAAALNHDGGPRWAIRDGQEAFREALGDEGWPTVSNALLYVGDNALRYMAERACTDPAARGREARRREYLRVSIVNIEHAAEARRRKR